MICFLWFTHNSVQMPKQVHFVLAAQEEMVLDETVKNYYKFDYDVIFSMQNLSYVWKEGLSSSFCVNSNGKDGQTVAIWKSCCSWLFKVYQVNQQG